MARKKRADIAPKNVPGRYLCVSYCVRQENLCGRDTLRQRDVSHRQQVLADLAAFYGRVFAVVVRHVSFVENKFEMDIEYLPYLVREWGDEEIVRRACYGFPNVVKKRCSALGRRWRPGQPAPDELLRDAEFLQRMRDLFSSLSDFHKLIKQRSAVIFNKEDGVRGCFWDGRFESIPLESATNTLISGLYLELQHTAVGRVLAPNLPHNSSAWARFRTQENVNRREESASNGGENPAMETAADLLGVCKVPIAAIQWQSKVLSHLQVPNLSDESWSWLLKWFGAIWRFWRLAQPTQGIDATVQACDDNRDTAMQNITAWLTGVLDNFGNPPVGAQGVPCETWKERLIRCVDNEEELAEQIAKMLGFAAEQTAIIRTILTGVQLTVRTLLHWCEALLADTVRAAWQLYRIHRQRLAGRAHCQNVSSLGSHTQIDSS